MRSGKFFLLSLIAAAWIGMGSTANAAVTIEDQKSGIKMNLGARLQSQLLFNDEDRNNDTEFKVRRARLRVGLIPHEMVEMFIQTDVRNDAGASVGDDVRVLDSWIAVKPDSWFQLHSGLRMSPTSRQNLTSSGALLAFDRPGTTNYSLTWGLRGNGALQNAPIAGTQGGTLGDNIVRDYGITLFGTGSLAETTHAKYYASFAEGSVQSDDTDRFTTRVQLNFGDAEPGYFNLATYLGGKDTVGLGFSFDYQEDIAMDSVTMEGIDYEFYSVDLFLEKPIGQGSLSFETAYSFLDLGDPQGSLASFSGDVLSGAVPAIQTQGDGMYAQIGYFIHNWQPFALFEFWNSDGTSGAGDWTSFRTGVAYYLVGLNANVKFAYEHVSNDTPGEGDVGTFGTGLFVTF